MKFIIIMNFVARIIMKFIAIIIMKFIAIIIMKFIIIMTARSHSYVGNGNRLIK